MQPSDQTHPQQSTKLSAGCSRSTSSFSRRSFIVAGLAAAVWASCGFVTSALAETGIKLPIIDDITQRVDTLSHTASALADTYQDANYVHALTLANKLSEEITALQEILNGTLVGVAEAITPYKIDIGAAKSLLSTAHITIDTAVIPITELLTQEGADLLTYHPEDGSTQFNIELIANILDIIAHAVPELRTSFSAIVGIEGDLHIEQLADFIDPLRANGPTCLRYLDAAERLLPLVPAVLGAGGPRTYLVVAQTNSEIAATGGFPGAMGYASLDNGRFEMGGFDSVFRTIPRQENAPLPLTDEEAALYGDAIGWATDVMGHNPDFPRAAELWAQANQQANGFGLDGVIALDPVFLQTMIRLANIAVPMNDGTQLDGNNTAELLLNTVYWNYLGNSSAQDDYFSEAATKTAETLFSNIGSLPPADLLRALSRAFSERRLNLWLADPAEEGALAALGLDNGVAGSADRPELGVFLSDEIWAKISWYLGVRLEMGGEGDTGGRRTVPCALTLENSITQEEVWAAGGNAYIVGYNEELKRADGDMAYTVSLYAPAGGRIEGFRSEGGTLSDYLPEPREASHAGRQVIQFVIKLLPGESHTVRFDVLMPEGCDAALEVDSTPPPHDTEIIKM